MVLQVLTGHAERNINSSVLDGRISIMQTDQTQHGAHFSIVRHITRSHEEAEEVRQETFPRAFLHLNACRIGYARAKNGAKRPRERATKSRSI